ncbi:hypothetical protein [Paraburkholderia sediminicola]|uniref:hypothetical protein n=1 Tax=Paraburkholderia sediminicola TaxID=458836 RepID=UPI0038BC4505
MNHTLIPNTNPDLRAVLVLHDAKPEYFPIIAWRVNAETATTIPVLLGGLQIAEGESMENWALTLEANHPKFATIVFPLDSGALPTTFEAFVARNAPELGE